MVIGGAWRQGWTHPQVLDGVVKHAQENFRPCDTLLNMKDTSLCV